MDLLPGQVVWVDFEPTRGREQGGLRPAVVVSALRHLQIVTSLAIVVPCTTRDRGWPNHVEVSGLTGLAERTWAMTEQPRSISRERILRVSGFVDDETLALIRTYLGDALDAALA